MNSIGATFKRDADDVVDRQIGLDGSETFADQIGFICLEPVQGKTIFVRVDRDGFETQLGTGAEDADWRRAAFSTCDALPL